jgi:hypothetical protein
VTKTFGSTVLVITLLIGGPGIAWAAKQNCSLVYNDCITKCNNLPRGTGAKRDNFLQCLKTCDVRQYNCNKANASGATNYKGPEGGGTKTSPPAPPPSSSGTNKGPSGPTTGTHPVINPPTTAGTNKGPSGGGTTTIEKGSGGKH